MISSRMTAAAALAASLASLVCSVAFAVELDERIQQLQMQEQIEAEEVQSRLAGLIERIDADDRDTRRRAVAELVFYADDPRAIEQLLARLATEAGRPALSTEGRINAIYVLLKTTPEAWTAPLLERAGAVLEVLAERDLPTAGPQQRDSIARLEDHIREIEAARTAVDYGVVQERTAETVALTDVDVFVCGQVERPEQAYTLARLLADRDFGRVRLRELAPDEAPDVELLEGHTTVVFDPKHPEAEEVGRLEAVIQELGDLPPFQAEPNSGAPTYWYLSVFVCP
jgi:HAMP domain-containing protein